MTKTCPNCGVEFMGHPLRIYCCAKCLTQCKKLREKHNKSISRGPLMQQLAKYGIRNDQIPYRADEEFLKDLLFALKTALPGV